MIVKSDKDLQGILEAGKIASEVMHKMASRIRPGITTGQLDMIGEEMMQRYGARSAPKVAYNFPGATCISILPEVAHGIPGSRQIKAGDMVNIDVSVELKGYFADTGMSVPVEIEDPKAQKICQVCLEARQAAIGAAKPGGRINEIGKAVEKVANAYGMTMIKNLCGHGLGRKLHEAPECILNYFSRRERGKLNPGQVIALEPFISEAPDMVENCGYNEWALVVPAGYFVVQFEHTVIVEESGNILATLLV
ncbi:MAG: type I methionyl aminopeptidase [Peptococcaceae bacterium]|jgi:methionyl aminopeptidase|nr:type I methionyl aminopeptidase [Peptococcaceae bacterium]